MNSFSFLKGNLGKDPEVRYTTNTNTKVATLSLATYRPNPKDKDKPFTDWFNCVAWGDEADIIESQLKKGMQVILTGRFQTRNYDDKDGKRVYVTEFWIDDIAKVLTKSKAQESTVTDADLPF